jgi:two-component system response regulator FixJ
MWKTRRDRYRLQIDTAKALRSERAYGTHMSGTVETVFIVDDDNGMRTSMRTLVKSVGLEAEPFASAQEFLDYFDPGRCGCLILDVRTPKMDGLELQQELNRRRSVLPVIFVTAHADVQMAVEAMRHGAFDFIEKPFRDQNLIDSVQRALARDRESRKVIQQSEHARGRVASLTNRERQVLELIASGQANKAMAQQLGLSRRTVEVHRSHLMHKLAVRSVAELVRIAMDLTAAQAGTRH